MSLGQDFLAGFQTTSGARERKREREEKIEQEQLRKQFELDRDAARQTFERGMQGDRITADATKQFSDQNWRTGERTGGQSWQEGQSEKERTYRTGERTATQGFTAEQAAADRALRSRQLDQGDSQFDRKINFDLQNMGLSAGMKAREIESIDKYRTSQERLNNLKADEFGNAPLPTTPGAKPALPRPPLSIADQNALAFARANPNDPFSKKILARLGLE